MCACAFTLEGSNQKGTLPVTPLVGTQIWGKMILPNHGTNYLLQLWLACAWVSGLPEPVSEPLFRGERECRLCSKTHDRGKAGWCPLTLSPGASQLRERQAGLRPMAGQGHVVTGLWVLGSRSNCLGRESVCVCKKGV